MDRLISDLSKKISELEAIIKEAEKYVSISQDGEIRISRKGSSNQYYLRTKEICKRFANGKYIKKEDRKIAIDIIQKDYCKEILAEAYEQLKIIEKAKRVLERDGLAKAYARQGEYRKETIIPVYRSGSDYRKAWENETYEGKDFIDENSSFYTNKGERVRSKSEKIIADYLFSHDIPYKYEKPLTLVTKSGRRIVVYPDFTLLDVANRREIYLEHLGMMDNPDYAENAVAKIETYENSGIFPGDGLLLSYETGKNQLDVRMIKMILEHAGFDI